MKIAPSQSHTPLILVVDDEKLMRLQLSQVMTQAGYRVRTARNGQEGLALYSQLQPDIVLLDAIMPLLDGFTCCAELQTRPEALYTPVLMITGLEDEQSVSRAFEVGAADYITKPIHWPVLLHRVRRLLQQAQLQQQQALLLQQLESANQRLQHLVGLDGLTEVANRRRFDEYLHQEWQRLTRIQQPLSLILADIDHFKAYNDTYGHPAGDDCLRQVAQTMQRAVQRATDLVARYGGEEFGVILPHTSQEGARRVAANLQAQVQALQLPHRGSRVSAVVTLSLGVVTTTPHLCSTPAALLSAADEALYQAKRAGRNRAIMTTQLP